MKIVKTYFLLHLFKNADPDQSANPPYNYLLFHCWGTDMNLALAKGSFYVTMFQYATEENQQQPSSQPCSIFSTMFLTVTE